MTPPVCPVVHISPCPPAEQLEAEWRALGERADGSVFLSWSWIGALLATSRTKIRLVHITLDGRLIGLALLGQGRTKIPGFAPTHHLNETGDPATDAIMMEYNAVLAERGQETAATEALIEYFAAGQIGPLVLSGVTGTWWEACEAHGLRCRLLRKVQPAPFADLQNLEQGDLIDALSRNSRQQIRRSMRHFEDIGPLSLVRAATPDQALAWFAELERLHTASWRARGNAGAFAHPDFAAFHRCLIEKNHTSGIPDLLCLKAADTVLGYLYNLRWRNVVSAYQSGFLFAGDPRWRPGLTAHLMAMHRYSVEGMTMYRFLAGDARYKKSLANRSDELYWMTAYKPNLYHDVTDRLREAKQLIRRAFSGASGPCQ